MRRCHLFSGEASQKQSALSLFAPITWSLTWQQNSVLFHIASPCAKLSTTWLTAHFWQQFADNLYLKNTSDVISSTPETTPSSQLSCAFMLNKQHQQIRFIATHTQITEQETEQKTEQKTQQSTDCLMFAVYIAPKPQQLPSIHWLDSCFQVLQQVPSVKWLLAGQPASGYIDPGPLVCSCMAVGQNIIINAITKHHCHSATLVGKQCRAGTNCGSCVGQINELIAEYT